jgi:hypothetical protein
MSSIAPSVSPLVCRLAPVPAKASQGLLAFLIVTPFFVPLAASLATLLAGLTLFAPLLWLAWLAQAEMRRFVPALQMFVAAPPAVPVAIPLAAHVAFVTAIPGL